MPITSLGSMFLPCQISIWSESRLGNCDCWFESLCESEKWIALSLNLIFKYKPTLDLRI